MRDHDAVDLELTIRPSGEGFVADARLADPGSQGDARLATDVPVALDPDALLAHGLDPAAYGRTLIAQVFADLRLRDAWRDARRVADGADLPLRLRLRLSTTDAGIHALRWETLRDPITDVPLATDARLLLVRSLDTDNTRPIRLEPKPALSALFVVANPSDLGRYEMAEIDVAGEVGRVQAALGGIALTVIGDVDGARSRRATLGAIQDALRAQPTIFCLMCHGQHTGDDTNLWLENNEGTTAHITGSVLTQILSQSDRPPLLVILIACEGGGKSHHDGPLAALGPRLAHTGVGAVLAMQDKVSISAATRLLPVLFEELARDGQIDRAVALARAALREGNEWWVPALWLRMRDGRLWADRQPDTTTPPIYSIPASFVRPATPLIGRAPLSADLRTRLCSSPNVRVALHGKPGAGKSRLALEIVADAAIRDYFTGGILVARLGVQGNSELEIRRWAVDLGMEDNPKLSVDEHLTQINQRISRDTRPWLVVVDDVWRVDQILPFVRCLVSLHLNLLITTRQRDELVNLGEYLADKQIIEVAVLEHAAAITLLRETAGLPPTGVEAELDLLVQLVGGLPLLLTVMGGYLRAQGAGQPDWFAQALTALKTASVRLNLPIAAIAAAQEQTSRRGWFPCLFAPKRTPSQPLSPRVIIGLSYDALPRTAQGVFIALAAFPSDPISFDLATANIVSEMSAAQLEPALRLLFQRSLLDDSEPGRFRMHHVLWDWAENHDRRAINEARRRLRRWHSDMTQAAHAEAFAAWRSHPDNWQQMINTWDAAIDDPDTLALCLQTILPVLIAQGYWNAVLAGLERAHEIFRKVASKRDLLALVRYYLGLVCYERAEYALAEQHTAAALSDFQLINSAHWQGIALSLLGGIHQAVGAYPAARACFEEVLTIIPETDEQNYATCLNNLANLFRAVGDYAAARPLYERALAIYEQALGPSHPDTASSLNNLAALFRAVGDYAAARPLYERALAIREQALGPRHPHTASSLNNLATLLQAVGDDAAARPLYERALAICEQALGPRHPHTASSLNNLATLLRAVGDDAAARPLYERALAICEQALGPRHPDTASSLNNLAGLLQAVGDYAAARPLFERALAIREQALGPRHPHTAISLRNLAALFYAMGDYAAARPLYERAIAITEQALGPRHPATATSLNNLAGLLRAVGDYAAARPLYERALAIREQALGPIHPDTAQSLNNLAGLFSSVGDYAAARPLYERALAIYEQALGPNHPDTARSLNNLAITCYYQGELAAATDLMRRALAIWGQALGPDHPNTQSARQSLAAIEQRLAENEGQSS